jgi:Protein of unknown function (DUF2442)
MDKQNPTLDAELQAQIDGARQAGAELDATEPRAFKAWYDEIGDRVFIELRNKVVMGFPPALLQGLREATPEQLMAVEITSSGYGLHWETLDADLSVPQLVTGVYGTQKWMSALGLHSRVR